MTDQGLNNTGGFGKTTNFKWLAVGLLLFTIVGFIIPIPESMVLKAEEVGTNAKHIQIIIALLSACVIFFRDRSHSHAGRCPTHRIGPTLFRRH